VAFLNAGFGLAAPPRTSKAARLEKSPYHKAIIFSSLYSIRQIIVYQRLGGRSILYFVKRFTKANSALFGLFSGQTHP